MTQPKLILFGPPRLELNRQSIELSLRKGLALLSYLATTGHPHSRDALATLFWPESSQKSARASLRRTVYDVGKRIDDTLLLATPETITLSPTLNLWLDVDAFKGLVQQGLGSIPNIDALTKAVTLYSDDFMAGFNLNDCPDYDEWQFFQREELRQIFASVLIQLIDAFEVEGEYETAVSYARRWLALDALHEPAHRKLMQLYALSGQQAAAIRQFDECTRILDEELGVMPEEETTKLYEAIRTRRFSTRMAAKKLEEVTASVSDLVKEASPSHPVAALSNSAVKSNLPVPPTPFVGRSHELTEITSRLKDPVCRLLTLIGTGGIGKTRLSIEAARNILLDDSRNFQDGIYFVPLQPVTNAYGIAAAIASAIDFQFYQDAPQLQQLLNYLRNKKMLLVLDNFEQLADDATVVSEILVNVLSITILVTSRITLNLVEEWLYPVTGLSMPVSINIQSEQFAEFDSVQLFGQTAQRQLASFSLVENREAVTRICRLVEGLPLGIELAASWLRYLPIEQISDELEQSFDILTTRHQNVPERHRSMRVVLDQSWQFLSSEEQRVLSRLSVFQGGFDRAAALGIANASLTTLATLVEKSLLQRSDNQRFQLHELLKQFAAEQLALDSLAKAEVIQEYCRYYLNCLEAHGPSLISADQIDSLEAIEQDFSNIDASWTLACNHGWFEHIASCLNGYHRFLGLSGRYQDGYTIFENTAACLETVTQFAGGIDRRESQDALQYTWRKVQARQGVFGTFLGRYDEAKQLFRASLALATTIDDAREMAFCHEYLGLIAQYQGDPDEAVRQCRRYLALGRELDDRQIIANALYNMGHALGLSKRESEAKEMLQESLTIYRDIGRLDRIAHNLDRLAYILYLLGELDTSQQYNRESVALFNQIGNRHGLGWAINGASIPLIFVPERQNLSEGLRLINQSIAIFDEIGCQDGLTITLTSRGVAYTINGEFEAAERDFRDGIALSKEINYPIGIAENYVHLGEMYIAKAEWERARRNLWQGLHIAIEAQFYKYAYYALIGFARLVVDAGDYEQGDYEQDEYRFSALVYLTVAAENLPDYALARLEVDDYITTLKSMLSGDLIRIALRQAQTNSLEDLTRDALDRFD